ncbi:MAG: hypothetical protein WD449_01990 [Candidatus Babeliales bacterium]
MIRGNEHRSWLLLALVVAPTIHAQIPETLYDAAVIDYEIQRRYKHQHRIIRDFFVDIITINKNLFSKRPILAFAAFMPAYIGVRHADQFMHKRFYDHHTHKDIHQLPSTLCKVFGDEGVAVPIVLLSSLAVFSRDERLRQTSNMFAKGVVAIQITKKIIKEFSKTDCNIRPLCGKFEKKQVYGGFPSGHMAVSTFMALMYGIRHGKAWGVPLGAYAIANFGVALNCNRHFASQLVMGAALGATYAFASLKTLKEKYGNLSCGMSMNMWGNPTIEMTYSY